MENKLFKIILNDGISDALLSLSGVIENNLDIDGIQIIKNEMNVISKRRKIYNLYKEALKTAKCDKDVIEFIIKKLEI